MNKQIKIAAVMILVAALSRLVPHPPNFAPIGAMALFGGYAFSNKRLALLIPLISMFISDVLLEIISGTGFHIYLPYVYGSFMLITFLGMWLRRLPGSYGTFVSITVAPMLSAVIFFIISNFGVWLNSSYGYNLQGLVNCYVMAIPFFYGTVLGDFTYCVLLFGGYAIIKLFKPSIAQ